MERNGEQKECTQLFSLPGQENRMMQLLEFKYASLQCNNKNSFEPDFSLLKIIFNPAWR